MIKDDMKVIQLVPREGSIFDPKPTWQPIDTAPKDGTVFLAYGRDVDRNFRGGVVALYWKYGRLCGPLSSDVMDWEPTHWMPLPDPPEEESK